MDQFPSLCPAGEAPCPPDLTASSALQPDADDESGCRFISADVDWRRWRYCGRPVRRGVWCAAHEAAIHRWRGHEERQRRGEDIIRRMSEAEPHEHV